ncbi:MAG TPA: AI-2E family transporter [Steroidobacteraceae bacterium]|nr:AI-2E family transporter [Steroidobacteraceae bacterium]
MDELNETLFAPRAKGPGRVALMVLAGIAVVAALHLGREVTMPIGLALFFAVILSPAVERLRRLGLRNGIAAAVVMLMVVGALATLIQLTKDPAQAWFARVPSVLSDVERKLRPLQQVAVRIDNVAAQAERVTGGASPTTTPNPSSEYQGLLRKTPAILVPVVGVFFLTFFLLASGPPLLARLGTARRRTGAARHGVIVVERARRELSRFLGTIALINLGLGTVTAGIAYGFDLPTPILWGLMAAVLNFIPYAGSATTLTVLTIVAIITHDTLTPAFGVALSYLTAATIEGQLVQPLALGRRLALSPLIVFLGLWVWGWIWGVAGLLLATPILLTIKSVSCQITSWGPLAEFLSPSAAPVITSSARAWRRARRRRRVPRSQESAALEATESEAETGLV